MTIKEDYEKMKEEMNYYKNRCEKLMLEIIRLNKKTQSKQIRNNK